MQKEHFLIKLYKLAATPLAAAALVVAVMTHLNQPVEMVPSLQDICASDVFVLDWGDGDGPIGCWSAEGLRGEVADFAVVNAAAPSSQKLVAGIDRAIQDMDAASIREIDRRQSDDAVEAARGIADVAAMANAAQQEAVGLSRELFDLQERVRKVERQVAGG